MSDSSESSLNASDSTKFSKVSPHENEDNATGLEKESNENNGETNYETLFAELKQEDQNEELEAQNRGVLLLLIVVLFAVLWFELEGEAWLSHLN